MAYLIPVLLGPNLYRQWRTWALKGGGPKFYDFSTSHIWVHLFSKNKFSIPYMSAFLKSKAWNIFKMNSLRARLKQNHTVFTVSRVSARKFWIFLCRNKLKIHYFWANFAFGPSKMGGPDPPRFNRWGDQSFQSIQGRIKLDYKYILDQIAKKSVFFPLTR